MSRQFHMPKNSRIEVLEPLVLMSASAAEIELLSSDAVFVEDGFDEASQAGILTEESDEGQGTPVFIALPVEPDGGIGDGAGPIPIEEKVVEGEVEFEREVEFQIVDELEFAEVLEDESVETIADEGTEPFSEEIRSSFSSEQTFVTSSSDGSSGDSSVPSGHTLLLDYAMSVYINSDGTAVVQAILPSDSTSAGPEAQSGVAESEVAQDASTVSESLVVFADPLPGIPIEQPPTYTPTIEGTDAGEWISATQGDDVIAAGSGDDAIYAPVGNNFVDGGEGVDTLVVYEGYSAQYTFVQRSDGVSFLEGPGLNGESVRIALYNVERIQFNDRNVSVWSMPFSDGNLPSGDPVITGTDVGEWIGGTAGNDNINAGSGDDEIYAPLGDNNIDGGDGEDSLLVYQGNRADYTLLNIGDGTIYLEGPGLNGETVRNMLSNVERILFNDEVVLTADVNDLGVAALSMNGPGLTSDSVVAGVSIVAAGGEEILMSASQAAVVIQEAGFEDDEALPAENIVKFSETVTTVVDDTGEQVAGLSIGDLNQLIEDALVIADESGLDFSTLTEAEVVAAGTAVEESLQQSRFDTTGSITAAVRLAADFLTDSGLDLSVILPQQILDAAAVSLDAEDLAEFETFLATLGIDLNQNSL